MKLSDRWANARGSCPSSTAAITRPLTFLPGAPHKNITATLYSTREGPRARKAIVEPTFFARSSYPCERFDLVHHTSVCLTPKHHIRRQPRSNRRNIQASNCLAISSDVALKAALRPLKQLLCGAL